ncbi:DeoR/GlpR family DNA-binding transcription regulator [Herbiconiux moechotypicola]|uniref:DeoR/GlpR family DNA-binding transcription regulator n=1 Tax=Herbiconiux moechotypicola TaxID=637393 RepID=A0ABN3DDD8_9MICO|nr:DeoR/GlpR family DNA-binding transcription regulator [Herbiconiux moechotypicola]MCS5729172.1 DeoR/GlpR family DNA-binding transcription regulator [Herbiconiux moechotypicola]
METSERREEIRERIEREGFVRLRDLSQSYGVSPVTIHRDLDFLVVTADVERVRGGARSSVVGRHEIQNEYRLRRAEAAREKMAIAERAMLEISDGSTIFLDSSTTALALAKRLELEPSRGLTLVTNSPAIAFQLHAPYIHVVVTPGELDQSLRALTGRWTAEFLEGVSLNTAFVSAAGIHEKGGLMTTQREVAEVTKALIPRSDRLVALVDSTKFDTGAFVTTAHRDELAAVITDDNLPTSVVERYRAAGYPIEVATPLLARAESLARSPRPEGRHP